MHVLNASRHLSAALMVLAGTWTLHGTAYGRHALDARGAQTRPTSDRAQIETVLDQLSAREHHTDYDLILRLEIELLCIANPDERDFLLAYLRHQVAPPSMRGARPH